MDKKYSSPHAKIAVLAMPFHAVLRAAAPHRWDKTEAPEH